MSNIERKSITTDWFWSWLYSNGLQTLLSDSRHSSAINVISISCWRLTKHSHPHFNTSDNTFRQFIATPRVVWHWQIKAGHIVILSYDSSFNWKLKVVAAMGGWTPSWLRHWSHHAQPLTSDCPFSEALKNHSSFPSLLADFGLISC